MPMFHTSGCGMITLNCLQAGYRMLLVEFFASLAVMDQVEISGADIILGVPPMIGVLLCEQEARVRNLSALKLVSFGCSIVSPDLVRRVHSLMRARFSIFYGQT